MMTKLIGQIMFPRLPAWEQQRRGSTALIVGLTTIGAATVVGLILYWINSHH